ncbi:3-hydroxybutyryl-CoA dehydratase [Aspergillus terreus]|uniref:3-hydroxybutyryl-CoA dehydratase n=1 Tax=Aspergillus terreus TaxID=33178 RepID=A0A5M3ZCU1_ASPTE|nr:hypothetical protein ATETN484_0015002100 [Aspergillus terreus]GFF21185.1 3-hydroxybutyryl-CoA dehydratase [Aspergillus terreus]
MSISRLEDLPADILRQIHDYLDDEHPRSLLNLALTSKRCYISAAYRLHRELRLSLSGCLDATDDDVRKCLRRLDDMFFLGYVRRLVIICDKVEDPKEPCETRFLYRSDRAFNEASYDETFLGLEQPERFDSDPDFKVNLSWSPLAEFIEKLGNLRELVFDAFEQFPRCLLESLHQFQPVCKLYINNFQLKASHTGRISGYERKLVTSPCLYGIRVLYDGTDGQNGYTRGSLESLTLGMCRELDWNLRVKPSKLTKNTIMNWGAITDFTCLETLHLLDRVDLEAVTLLERCSFPSLKSLTLSFGQTRPSRRWIIKLQHFFANISSLLTLRLSEWSDFFPLHASLDHHTGLTTLLISPTPGACLEAIDLQYLSTNFLSLVELSIPIRRARGCLSEVSGYKMLGALPNLRYLKLELCTLPKVILENPWHRRTYLRVNRRWSQFRREWLVDHSNHTNHEYRGTELRNGHIMEILTNSAIDEPLACSIFQAISSGKPHNAVPLERLRLEVNGLANVEGPILRKILRTISPLWCIERVPSEKGCFATSKETDDQAHMTDTRYTETASETYETILRYVWPPKENSAWQDSWKSIPLRNS